ncbi:SDR family oxidoreductase [Pseudonocardia sp. RS11V-5]|uniref:SDR family NAD(P)-dependent oxidoreductase n=1 Tax=Pseudonocardia terrae TaxID=2905831 RepID=UPI001E301F6F|nr:SDR family oxidoreductase [Pseudonocardia terrae]MCE3551406.1 SDR family oxidoreductase [Pseudonocardia terrae]
MTSVHQDQVAVVTGGAHGIGRATCELLAAAGAHVVVVDVDGGAAEKLAAELPTESVAVVGDVADEATVDAYMSAAVARFGRVDLHHLNAGIGSSLAPFPDLDVADFDRTMAVNVRGMFLGLRAAFRDYRRREATGAVVLTASIASLRGSADLIAYQTSKHAVLGLLHGAAVYGGPLGIRVNAVAPGIVPTELFAANADKPGGRDDMRQRASTSPLRRAGTPQEIASVATFLLGPGAGYVTGSCVSADGGSAVLSSVRPSGGAGAWDHEAVDRQMYG